MPQPLPSIFLLIHYLLITLLFMSWDRLCLRKKWVPGRSPGVERRPQPRPNNLTIFMCRVFLAASTSWNPKGLSRPVQGLLYVYRNIEGVMLGRPTTGTNSNDGSYYCWSAWHLLVKAISPFETSRTNHRKTHRHVPEEFIHLFN